MKRILFVDDESRVLDGMRRMFHCNRGHWEIHFAAGGEDAIRNCETTPFDVVISDMRMPGMDGATLLGHVRDLLPDAARIILSGYSEAGLATRAVSVAHRVLAKPCDASELQSAIERVIALQDLICSPEIRKIVGAVGELPSLSSTYASLTRAVTDQNTSVNQIAQIIERDVAMSAKVLQLTNSAFFGLSRRVANLTDAVSILGMNTIKNLALASEAFRVFVPSSRIGEAVCRSIQDHAMKAASIASTLPLDPKIREGAVIGALLHDIGQLFIAYRMPEVFCAVLAKKEELNCRTVDAEEMILGTSHAEIGAYLLGLWDIPNIAVEAIAHHHHLDRIPHTEFDAAVAVYIADMLAHESDRNSSRRAIDTADPNLGCLESLGLLSKLDEFRALAEEQDREPTGPVGDSAVKKAEIGRSPRVGHASLSPSVPVN